MTIRLDPERTALLVIDMQNGFCHPEGGLAKSGQDNAPQVAVVPAVKELVRLARGAGIRAAWSKQVHFPAKSRPRGPRHGLPPPAEAQGGKGEGGESHLREGIAGRRVCG